MRKLLLLLPLCVFACDNAGLSPSDVSTLACVQNRRIVSVNQAVEFIAFGGMTESGPFNYAWDVDSGQTVQLLGNSVIALWTKTGDYTVTVTEHNVMVKCLPVRVVP